MNSGIIPFEDITLSYTEIDDTVYIAVKPVCEILGIDYATQQKVIKSHLVYKTTAALKPIVAGDGKTRDMVCLPLQFVLGWIMNIDARNVKYEVRDQLVNLQQKCCEALYNRFFGKYRLEVKLMELAKEQRQALAATRARIKQLREEREAKEQMLPEAPLEIQQS